MINADVIHIPGLLDYSTCLDVVSNWKVKPVTFISKEEFKVQYTLCKKSGKSVGIMIHHFTFDEERLEFLQWMLDYVKNDPDVDIIKMQDLYS